VAANDFDVGIQRLRRNLAEFRADGEKQSGAFLALVAAALGKAGKPGDGLLEIDAALVAVERTGEREYEAEVYRVKASCCWRQTPRMPSRPRSRSSPLSRSRENSTQYTRSLHAP